MITKEEIQNLKEKLIDAVRCDESAKSILSQNIGEGKLEAVYEYLKEFDPTPDGSFLFWIVHQYAERDFSLADRKKVYKALDAFYVRYALDTRRERRRRLIELTLADLTQKYA